MSSLTTSNISAYEDGLKHLGDALKECSKTSGVNLLDLLGHCKDCLINLEHIKQTDDNETRLAAVDSLMENVQSHCLTVTRKIEQLKQRSQGRPNTAETSTEEVNTSSRLVNTEQGQGDAGPDRQVVSMEQSESGQHKGTVNTDQSETGHDRRVVSIESTILKPGKLGFNDVAGLDVAKQALTEAIIIPIQFPHLFKGSCQPWKRILLYGPPGTGKSRLAQAVSSEIKSTFYSVSSADLLSSFVGESEKLIKELFRHAKSCEGRSVVFIDEIDSVCRRRSTREEEHVRRVKTELLRQMEGATETQATGGQNTGDVFLLCATNCPWELDPAFLRRFQKRIYISLPDSNSRMEVLKLHLKGNEVNMDENDWRLLVEQTQGMSGSDLANLVLDVLFEPIRDLQTSNFWMLKSDGTFQPCTKNYPGAFNANLSDLPPNQVSLRKVILQDFVKLLSRHKNTVDGADLSKYEAFTKSFGQNG